MLWEFFKKVASLTLPMPAALMAGVAAFIWIERLTPVGSSSPLSLTDALRLNAD